MMLFPLVAVAVGVGAQDLSAFKKQLSTPDASSGSRVELTEHGAAAAAVAALQASSAEVKVKGYRIQIFSNNVQNARSLAQAAEARFKELYPNIPVYPVYDNPYFKVTVGNCLTVEEANILWGKVKNTFDRAIVVQPEIPLSLFKQSLSLVDTTTVAKPVE